MSNEMLEKLVSTSSIGGGPGGGYLTIDQANTFIDHIFDAAVLWNRATRKKMSSNLSEWPEIRVGARVVRGATEGVDDGKNAVASFTKVSLQTAKFRFNWEVSTESLEDNIEGESFDNHLLRKMTHQVGQDLEEVSIWGDDSLSAVAEPLLHKIDGWHKQALAYGHVRPAASGTGNAQLSREHFYQALRALPVKYTRRKADLGFYVAGTAYSEYLYSQSTAGIVPDEIIAGERHLRNIPLAQGAAGDSNSFPFGVGITEVPMFDSNFNETNAGTGSGPLDATTFLELTPHANRLVGIQRDIKIYRNFAPQKDTYEYVGYVRMGVGWQNPDAVVTLTGIPVDTSYN